MHSIKDIVKQLIGKSLDAYNTKYTKVLNTRIDNIVAQAGNDNTEIVDARIDSAGVTHTTLNNRILAETKMNDEQLVEYTGSSLSAEDTTQGYLKDVEILGNTIQNEEDLADIKSVGELQEDGTYKMSISSCGKNLFNPFSSNYEYSLINGLTKVGHTTNEDGSITVSSKGSYDWGFVEYQNITVPKDITMSFIPNGVVTKGNVSIWIFESNGTKICEGANTRISFISTTGKINIRLYVQTTTSYSDAKITYKPYLTEGTVATDYEPYQGNKCDILLPCQLEKVGDVSDRLYYDDVEKAWCIEKNVVKIPLYESVYKINGDWETLYFSKTLSFDKVKNASSYCISSLLNYNGQDISTEDTITQLCIFGHANNFECRIRLRKDEFPNITTNEDYIKWATENDFYILLQSASPQKIVLPLDVQIQLNSFFGTTHIYMESGEVEGTIKCKIPKSLGATVQSLNNKTDILSDRIEAIEGLKDSQNMKYETDKGYLVCKETKNGVIDDLKIEGKTLVNLFQFKDIVVLEGVNLYASINTSYKGMHQNKTLTIINNTTKQIIVDIFNDTSWVRSIIVRSYEIAKAFSVEGDEYVKQIYGQGKDGWGISEADKKLLRGTLVLLEGDHTQNPPSYFEGLMSVGQDVDEIEVSSANKNLLNEVEAEGYYRGYETGVLIVNKDYNSVKGKVVPNTRYVLRTGGEITGAISNLCFFDKNFKFISGIGNSVFDFTTPMNCRYITIAVPKAHKEVQLELGDTPTKYIPPQSDKKQILFYNENGELEPIQELHEWDSIEKHSDNKWYYHKRSGKVVLDGSENWIIDNDATKETSLHFRLNGASYNLKPTNNNYSSAEFICDKFTPRNADFVWCTNTQNPNGVYEGIAINTSSFICARVLKSKLSTQDVAGFKQWLQANNVTVVYQLAEEEVYELAPLHLDSYANETLILCNSGAISPKMEFSITSHINELVKAYGERINLLEEKVYQYMVTQNRMQLASTYSADSVTFKVDYFSLCGDEENYDEDLYNLILNNILVGKDNYDYDKMFTMILDYASWNQISWEQFDILVGLMDIQHNPPVEEEITEDETIEETPVE